MSDDNYVFRYTRKEAIADGVLVDVTEAAKSIGFIIPVAMTRDSYEACVAWGASDPQDFGQTTRGRLHDVLWTLRVAIATGATRVNHPMTHGRKDALLFRLLVVPRPGYVVPQVPLVRYAEKNEVVLLSRTHGGDNVTEDNPDPVITISFFNED